jgi:hypothetical protein
MHRTDFEARGADSERNVIGFSSRMCGTLEFILGRLSSKGNVLTHVANGCRALAIT